MSAGSILFLGTGNAFNTDGRASQSLLVRQESGPSFLVDVGPTISLSLERSRVDTAEIDKAFITHLHGDHIAGWPFFVLRAIFLEKRSRPLDVFGPPGVGHRLRALLELCYDDMVSSGLLRFPLRSRELPVEEAYGVDCGDGLSVDVLPQEHHESSLGYAFLLPGAVVGVSGDAGWSENLEHLVRRSSVVILECTTVEKTAAKHVSLEEIRSRADLFRDRRAVLVHTNDAVAQEIERQPIPGVIAASDGMVLEL